MLQEVWKRDGEGLILKQLQAPYLPGKRPKATWLKMKALKSAAMTLYGFKAGKMGPQSVMLLRDDTGNETQTKWKNLEQLDAFNANPQQFIGRRVRIEFQERTPEGNYRHPRFDRWEDE
jgi:ATP-dependent DNA ligase